MVRNRPRPAKQRAKRMDDSQVEVSQIVLRSTTSATGTGADTTAKHEPPRKKIKLKNLGSGHIETDFDVPIPHDLPNEEMEKLVAFCCYQCFCSEEDKDKVPKDDAFVQLGDNGLYHRRCCHKLVQEPDETEKEWEYRLTNWKSPYCVACDNIYVSYQQSTNTSTRIVEVEELQEMYNNALPLESAIYNADGQPTIDSKLETSPEYVANRKRFGEIQEREHAVVLDMFAGIGCGIIALKRLGIAMKKIIHVEIDPVANHVYKWNHDMLYNDNLPDDQIEHEYYDKFEHFEDDNFLQDFLSKHGPIDLIVGGPPCSDYSGVNARRHGVKGQQGSYMPRFGAVIQKIQGHQPRHHVFFLAENTILRNKKNERLNKGDLEVIKESFGVEWAIESADASYFSPCRRNRSFLSNLPISTTECGDYVDDENLDATCYLTDGFTHGAYHWCDIINIDRPIRKVHCFLASLSKIDSPVMMVVKKQKNSDEKYFYEGRPYSVREREGIMGFPAGYVDDAAKDLFEALRLAHGNINIETESYWKNEMPQKYHIFGGLPCKLYSSDFQIYVKLQRPPNVIDKEYDGNDISDKTQAIEHPNTVNDDSHAASDDLDTDSDYYSFDGSDSHVHHQTKRPRAEFYNQEQYSKRLIGNAFSIPVVEILLRKLKDKFGKQEYALYNYKYVWRNDPMQIKNEDDL